MGDVVSEPTTEAVNDDHPGASPNTRPTAEILGDFHRGLRKEGFTASETHSLVHMAAGQMFDRGPLVTDRSGGEAK